MRVGATGFYPLKTANPRLPQERWANLGAAEVLALDGYTQIIGFGGCTVNNSTILVYRNSTNSRLTDGEHPPTIADMSYSQSPSAAYEPSRQGYVYILRSPSVRGTDPVSGGDVMLLKIGATRNHPIQRAKEVSAATGVAEPYRLAYYRDFADAFIAERLVHERFVKYRINKSREFFAAPIDDVIEYLSSLSRSREYAQNAALESTGDIGGECGEGHGRYSGVTARHHAPRASIEEETPWAALFATFNSSNPEEDSTLPPNLTPEESHKCRELERRLAARR